MYIISSGIIIYDPPRGKMKKKTDWWAVVEIDKEITRYFRWWVERELNIKLQKPSWDAHISIVRGEKPAIDKLYLWEKYHKRKINFKYSVNVRQSGDTTGNDRPSNYWFVEVECPFLKEIREEFGFPSDWKQHITIGRTWD
jgi:hypothetical protein